VIDDGMEDGNNGNQSPIANKIEVKDWKIHENKVFNETIGIWGFFPAEIRQRETAKRYTERRSSVSNGH